MADYHVTLYSGPETPDLEKARKWLAERRIQYEEKNIVESTGARGELLHHTGGKEYPTLNVDGHVVVGFLPEKWNHLLGEEYVGRT